MSRVTLTAVLLLAPGCTIDELQLESRWCNPDYPCASGYSCVKNQCSATSADAPGPVPDGPLSDHGLADRTVNDGPGPDADLARFDLPPDLPALDAGCPSGKTSCGGLCVDLLTDFNHCGGCNQPCGLESDRCEGGNCYCDHNKPICTGGLSCVGAKCLCVAGTQSLCTGCCASSTQCAPGTTVAACGQQPDLCATCISTNPCLTPVCLTTHTCATLPKANGSTCALSGGAGRCYNSNCCTGCWMALTGACLSGTSSSACGTGGNNCLTCSTGYTCIAGKCTIIKLP